MKAKVKIYLGIDWGERRIGLASGDSDLRFALPLPAAVEPTPEARMEHLLAEIRRLRVSELVVGYPYNMDGSVGFKAKEVDAFIAEIEPLCGLVVHRIDERLTSQIAEQLGSHKKKPKSIAAAKRERASGSLDSRAAAVLLQDFLDALPMALET